MERFDLNDRLYFIWLAYLKSDSNTHEIYSEKLKFSLSSDSSTQVRAKVTRTLIITVMSSTLYLLSYNPFISLYAVTGLTPVSFGNEPNMFILH